MAIQPGWGSQWETLANAITRYYGGGIESAQYQQVVQMLNSGEYTMEEMESILGQIPEFSTTYNAAGELTRVSYNVSTNSATSAAGTVAQQVNSNVANSTQTQFSTVQTITKDSQTGKVTISDNVVKYKTGQLAPTNMKAVPISAVQGILAASTGITLGKKVNQLAYDKGFNWLSWAGVSMEDINPAAWSSITDGQEGLGADLFNLILGIDDNTNNPQAYMDENAFAYMTAYMIATGVFEQGRLEPPEYETGDVITSLIQESMPIPPQPPVTDQIYQSGYESAGFASLARCIALLSQSRPYATAYQYYTYRNEGYAFAYWDLQLDEVIGTTYNETSEITVSCTFERYYEDRGTMRHDGPSPTRLTLQLPAADWYLDDLPTMEWRSKTEISGNDRSRYYINVGASIGPGGVEGITDQEGATQFDPSGLDPSDIAAILAALKLQFPGLWDERVEVSPDGDTVITYIPVGFPTGGTGQMPTTEGATQDDLAPDISGDGDNSTDELIKTLIDAITHPQESEGMESTTNTPTKPVDPNGDPRGSGENPPIVPPVGSASALWKIYNPSQSQLDTFGAWLWSSNFVDQLLKLFNDPMQAIIGLHKVYCTPPTSGSGPIKVGYLVSDASANYVSNQYTEIDCGSVDMKEHFNNAFDYDEFTRISIFLPFIGFKDLDVKDIMRSSINVKYGVDVLTGACLAKITVTRDLNSPILYTFAGNCAVQYPVSSGSYIGIITGLCSLIGGVAGSLATGGALAPALVGATAGLPRMHTNVEHSGSISSNAGAMGPKKPYIVIQRPQTHMPLNGLAIEGEGQNESVVLGTLTGYVKVKKADLMGIPATGSELDEIRDLLEAGIYMY